MDLMARRTRQGLAPWNKRVGPRAAIGVVAGIGVFALVLFIRLRGITDNSDFDQFWIAARAIVHGRDPYAAVAREWLWPLFYPAPAALVAVPLVWLPVQVAHAAFAAVSVGALAYAISERPVWLLALVSQPLIYAVERGQWSPLLVAAAFLPWFGFAYAAKPTLGLVMFAYRPSWRAALSALVMVILSLALVRNWPTEWVAATRLATHVKPPIAYSFGPVALLALLRWRRREARLIAMLACVPQTFVAYETLPLFLVPETRLEMLILVTLSAIAEYAVRFAAGPITRPLAEGVAFQAPYRLAFLYLPALAMVLLRPNIGQVPAWLEERLSALPAWLRGATRLPEPTT